MFLCNETSKDSFTKSNGRSFLSDYLICLIEKELLKDVADEEVLIRFQTMSERRMLL